MSLPYQNIKCLLKLNIMGIRTVPFSTSYSYFIKENWRERRGLPENPNQERALQDLPDYSFVDGRPTPYGSKQRLRIEAQRAYTAKIIQLTEEVDLAMRLYSEREAEKKALAEERIARKLKQKGDKILNTSET